MARPKDADSAATYEAIIGAALELLAELPTTADLSLRKVGLRAGVSIGTIQYYFTSKEELVEACLDGYYERLGALAVRLTEVMRKSDAPPGTIIEDTAREFFRFAKRERHAIALRLASNAQKGEIHPRRQESFMGDVILAAAKSTAHLVEVSELDMRLTLQALASMVVRMALLSDSEVRALTDLEGAAAREAIEQFVVRAARRLVRPSDG